MVRGQTALVFFTLPVAVLADIVIARQYGAAPSEIARVLEASPGLAAFPFVMARTFRQRAVLKFGGQNLGLRFGREPAPLGLCAELGARAGGSLAP